MLDRAEGYVTELPYTPGYHEGLDPSQVRRQLRKFGREAPVIRSACELGFGRGVNIAIHAVAGESTWWGNDLLPAHVEGVRALTQGLTDRLHVFAESFTEFFARSDLPQFDFIGLHGVWSWVSADNRARIVEFIDRRLAPGGVVYLSYNLLAGWQAVLPLREFLVREAARPELATVPLTDRIEAVLLAAQRHVASDPVELADDPEFERHLRRIRHQRKSYLAHEYFNRDWTPFNFTDVARVLRAIGLEYAGQADGESPGASDSAAEHAADLLQARKFRRDLWIRPRRDDPYGRGLPRDTSDSPDRSAAKIRPRIIEAVSQLNDRLMRMAISEPQLSRLASPLTGGGVEVGWRNLLALAAWRNGVREACNLAAQVRMRLHESAHPLVLDGVVVNDEHEIASILRREASEFLADLLPRLRSLQIEPDLSL